MTSLVADLAHSERLNLRLPKGAKTRLERAAAHEGKSVSAYILSHILRQAEETIEKHEVMHVRGEYAKAFFEAIENPPPYNAKLRAALAEHEFLPIRHDS